MLNYLVNGAFFVIFLMGIVIVIKTRFIQFRILPKAIQVFSSEKEKQVASDRLSPKQALLLSMSTTIGIGNIIGPVLAIVMSGPGSMVWFVLASLIGSGVVYAETILAFKNRSYGAKKIVGPMGHLSKIHPALAVAYSCSTSFLLMIWNSSQSHILADICLRTCGLSTHIFGIFLALITVFVLHRGTTLIRDITDRIVPFMLFIYLSALFGILIKNRSSVIPTFHLIFRAFFSPGAALCGVGTFSSLQAMRWGVSRNIAAIEAGIGTSSIPHSLATGNDAELQANLSVLGAYINSMIGFLTGFTVIASGCYASCPTNHPLSLLCLTFGKNIPFIGEPCLHLSIFLFAFGTVLGNSFNGLTCWEYLCDKKGKKLYLLLLCITIFLGCISPFNLLIEVSDIFMLCSMSIQMFGVTWFVLKGKCLN